jgi:hypothetical protein
MVVQFMRDFSERQSQLFVMITTFLVRYETPDLPALLDDDVAEGMSALAATFDTASRGVIYDHQPASVLAGRLTKALKPLLAEAGQGAGSVFERDAAVVLRRIGDAVGDVRALDQGNRTAFLDLLRRVISKTPGAPEADPDARPAEPARLIVP